MSTARSKALGAVIAEYLDYRALRYSKVTVDHDKWILLRFRTVVGDKAVDRLTPEDVESYMSGLLRPHTGRDGKIRPAVSASSHNMYLRRLRSFSLYLSRRHLNRTDLLAHCQPLRQARKVRQQADAGTLWAMLVGTVDPRDRAVIAVALNSGLRAGEIARIRIKDLDLANQSLHVVITKSGLEDDLPVTSDLADEMAAWLKSYALSIGRPLYGEDYLIPARLGPRYRWMTSADGSKTKSHTAPNYVPNKPGTRLHQVIQSAMERVGLESRGEGVHTLRRSVARIFYDQLQAEGGHESACRIVGALLHHASITTTEAYIGVSSERTSRDQALKGRSLVPRPVVADVVSINR